MSYGIVTTKENETADNGRFAFDSSIPRLQVAVDKDPKHLDRIRVLGNNQDANVGNGFYIEETLFSIDHGLKYTPKVLVYFNNIFNNIYNVGRYYYAFGAADDYLTYRVNETSFKIIHITTGYGAFPLTSAAQSAGLIQIKYMILSNPVAAVTDTASHA